MRCEVCPHMKKIKDALAPCQTCDAGVLMGTTHPDAGKMDYALERRTTDSRAPTGGVTNLAQEDEDKLRMAMSTLFGLDPIDFLLVQHLFAGKTLSSFGDTLVVVERKIRRYHGTIRSMASAKKDAIVRAFPAIEPIFKHLIDDRARQTVNPDSIDRLIGDDDADRTEDA